ncbi:hypothetical protein EC12264_4764 [Escherichia coli 1.2264]|nr:hypothetical protein EC12264_4764 [Escherichia coli 1.2264]
MLFLILPEMCPLHLTCFQHRVIGGAVFFYSRHRNTLLPLIS